MKNRNSSGPTKSPKIAIVTGASSGLGLAISKKLLDKKWIVFGLSKTKKHWKYANKQLQGGGRFLLYQCNVAKENDVKHFFLAFKKKADHLDLLINNSGYASKLQRLDDISSFEFMVNIKHNLLSVFLMCKYAIPILHKVTRGFIINISSMAGKRAVPKLAAYSASKFGVLALSQCVAKENTTKISCVTACPGGMNTKMRKDLFGKKDAERQQSPEYVASVLFDIIDGKIKIESGGDVLIRHGKITAINDPPSPI